MAKPALHITANQALQRIEERAGAENSKILERASGLCAKRSDQRRTNSELEALMRSEAKGRQIVLDLKDITLVGREAISFLKRCEADNIQLNNCPAYIREWITRERGQN